ncbi:MAG: M48 family metallopeptidase [Paludibacter sp.]|jgi:predicted metal-dependent hydrolase|nr:M48 family metallopeptidase [Paludibacter sp.]
MFDGSVFGNIEFIRSTRVRRLSVRISAEGIKVMLAPGVSDKEAVQFVETNKKLILQKQQKIIAKHGENRILLNENSTLHTRTFDIIIKRAERTNVFFRFKDAVLTIEIPTTTNCEADETQVVFWNGIKYFLRKEAKRILPVRLKTLAEQFGFTYSNVKIQSSRGRWGSCSTHKSINFSFYLMLLPQHLIDYVILHELCHTREMNHSEKFWLQMDKVTANTSKALRHELKNYKLPHIPD